VAKQMFETLDGKPHLTAAETETRNAAEEKVLHLEHHLGRVDRLQNEANRLRTQGKAAIELGLKVRGDKSELATKYMGYPALVTGSLAKSAFTAVQAGTGLAKGAGAEVSLKVGAQALGISAKTLQVTGLVGAGASIAIDSYDFYKTAKAHNQELSKVEMAEALLTDHAGRETMATKLEAAAARLEQTGLKGSMIRLGAKLNPFAKNSDPEVLRDKATAIRALPQELRPETLDPKVKAVVTQIKEHADLGKKRMAMIKNVVGIVGAGLAIAALTVACPPAGLVAAACVIGVAAGAAGLYMTYNNMATSNQRYQNVVDIRQSIQQVDLKQKLVSQEIETLSARPDAGVQGSETAQKLETLQASQRELDSLKVKATLNLLAASPDDAAELVLEQAKNGDRAMHFIATTVLGVPYTGLPDEVALDALARGMHYDVNK
jgi:hypothetical protein